MVNVDNFKTLVSGLNCQSFPYYIFGGFAIDGLYGECEREHGDVDILVYRKNKNGINSYMASLGLVGEKHSSGKFLRFNHPDFQSDVLFLHDDGEYVCLDGAKALVRIPRRFFKGQKGVIENIPFNIIPLEWMIQLIPYTDNSRDRERLMPFIGNVSLDDVRQIVDLERDPFHPNVALQQRIKSELGLS